MEALLIQTAGCTLSFVGKHLAQGIESIRGNEEAIKTLAMTVECIRDVLSHVHGTEFKEESVKNCHKRLRAAFLDAEDFLDRIETLRRKREAVIAKLEQEKEDIKKMNGKVQRFLARCQVQKKFISTKVKCGLSKYNQANATKENDEIEKIKKELVAISKVLKGFRIGGTNTESDVTHNARGTGSHVDATEIIGREQDQREIVKLLKTSSHDQKAIRAVSIVGMGGMGKTTLAQLVFNDIGCNFDLKLWASDCKKFRLEWLLKKLLLSIDSKANLNHEDPDNLKNQFVEGIRGKKVFLVLDDVEFEETFIWDHLTVLLKEGNTEESRILVTTRSKQVTSGIGAKNSIHQSIHQLKGLSEYDSWSLFGKFAFLSPRKRDENLTDIAHDIVKRCVGVPLAIKVIGTHLKGKHISAWEHVKDCGLEDEDDSILPILKISYDGLDLTLKQCFSLCALFPKNCQISWQVLRNIWTIYVNFKEEERKTLQEVCNHKLEILCERFFLEKTSDKTGDDEEDSYFKMHDLMHDLTTKVAGEEMLVAVDPNKLVFKENNVRHLTLDHGNRSYDGTSTFDSKARRIRTFIQVNCPWGMGVFPVSRVVISVDKLVSACPFLRVLDLQCSGIEKLTDSIGKLIHLRYLDISGNQFETLPDSVTELINLRYLNLQFCEFLTCLPNKMDALTSLEELNISFCYQLKELPKGIVKLHNLKNLGIKNCHALNEMPSGICALTVSRFLVGRPESKDSAQLEELRHLPELKEGKLTIQMPSNTTLKDRGDGEAYLVNKKWLRDLQINWVIGVEDMNVELEPENHIDIFAKLQPPTNLEKLFLDGYQGMTFPHWVPQGGFVSVLPNLVEMHLQCCDKCLHLPLLSKLPFLRSLALQCLRSLEYIEDNISPITSFCPSLEKLDLYSLPKLKGWCRRLDNSGHEQSLMLPSFPRLNTLSVALCSNLRASPLLFSFVKHSLSLFDVVLKNKGAFELSFKQEGDKHSLSLMISNINSTESTSIYMDEAFRGMIDRLTHLTITCSELKTLPRGLQHLITLQELEITQCHDFTWEDDDNQSLEHQQTSSDGEMSRKPFKSLQVLTLRDLPMMVRLPKWIQLVTSLRELTLLDLPKMKTLPEWIQLLPSLQVLKIKCSPNLIVPEWVHNTFQEKAGKSDDDDDDASYFVSGNEKQDRIVPSILPQDIIVPSIFQSVGHIAHLNLREEHLSYRD